VPTDFQLASLIQQSQSPVVATDTGGRIRECNHAAQQIFQLDQPCIGKPLAQTILIEDFLVLFDSQPDEENPVVLRSGEISFAGEEKVFSVQVTHVWQVGALAILQNVSHLRQIDRIKSEFVNTLSRDLRSPLTAIVGYVELLERMGPLNEQQRSFIGRIIFSTQSITNHINNMLNLNRIETEYDIERQSVQMSVIIRYAQEAVQERVQQKSQHLIVNVMSNLPHVYGNPIRLRQLIMHLLENSIRYTPQNGHIRVSLSRKQEFVLLEVSDTGIGISVDEQPYIFEKFYRGTNASQVIEGSGLGLTIVKSIVEQHHGRIWVQSQKDAGSTFTVMLPAYPVPVQPES
jgi:two-component system NtrC family sensor kinase